MFGSLRDVRIPLITTQQMREVDRLMTEKYGIQLLQLMENAGRNLAELVRKLLGNSVQDKHVIVVAGKGNNAGGGMVAVRHLVGDLYLADIGVPNVVYRDIGVEVGPIFTHDMLFRLED